MSECRINIMRRGEGAVPRSCSICGIGICRQNSMDEIVRVNAMARERHEAALAEESAEAAQMQKAPPDPWSTSTSAAVPGFIELGDGSTMLIPISSIEYVADLNGEDEPGYVFIRASGRDFYLYDITYEDFKRMIREASR